MLADPGLLAKYKKKVEDLILQGHAVEVPHDSGQLKGRKWHIHVPNHCVTSKLRVFFDAAAQFQQTSLNEQTFPGLDLTNNPVGVLIRFRKYPVAVVVNVRVTFSQVRVAPVDQSALRFLWWNDGNPTRLPK